MGNEGGLVIVCRRADSWGEVQYYAEEVETIGGLPISGVWWSRRRSCAVPMTEDAAAAALLLMDRRSSFTYWTEPADAA